MSVAGGGAAASNNHTAQSSLQLPGPLQLLSRVDEISRVLIDPPVAHQETEPESDVSLFSSYALQGKVAEYLPSSDLFSFAQVNSSIFRNCVYHRGEDNRNYGLFLRRLESELRGLGIPEQIRESFCLLGQLSESATLSPQAAKRVIRRDAIWTLNRFPGYSIPRESLIDEDGRPRLLLTKYFSNQELEGLQKIVPFRGVFWMNSSRPNDPRLRGISPDMLLYFLSNTYKRECTISKRRELEKHVFAGYITDSQKIIDLFQLIPMVRNEDLENELLEVLLELKQSGNADIARHFDRDTLEHVWSAILEGEGDLNGKTLSLLIEYENQFISSNQVPVEQSRLNRQGIASISQILRNRTPNGTKHMAFEALANCKRVAFERRTILELIDVLENPRNESQTLGPTRPTNYGPCLESLLKIRGSYNQEIIDGLWRLCFALPDRISGASLCSLIRKRSNCFNGEKLDRLISILEEGRVDARETLEVIEAIVECAKELIEGERLTKLMVLHDQISPTWSTDVRAELGKIHFKQMFSSCLVQ